MNSEKLDYRKFFKSGEMDFISTCETKRIGPHTRLEENLHLPVSRISVFQFEHARACARATAVRMRNEIHKNNLKCSDSQKSWSQCWLSIRA